MANLYYAVVIVHWVACVSPSTIFVFARFVVRYFRPEMFNVASDVFVLLAFFLQVIFSIFLTLASTLAEDLTKMHSIEHIDKGATELSLKMGLISVNIFWTTNFAIKAAVLSIYSSLIPKEARYHRLAFTVLCWVVGASFIVVTLMDTISCLPVRIVWSFDPKDKRNGMQCFPATIPYVFITSSALHIGTDVALYMMPFPLLYRLWRSGGVERKSIIGLAGMFSVGFFCVIATILRIFFSEQTEDGVIMGQVWSGIELMTGMFVACFPAFRAMVKKGTVRDIIRVILRFSKRDHDIREKRIGSFSHKLTHLRSFASRRGPRPNSPADDMPRKAITTLTATTLTVCHEEALFGDAKHMSSEGTIARDFEGTNFEATHQHPRRGTVNHGTVVWEGGEESEENYSTNDYEDIEIGRIHVSEA